ncbi:COG4705 family protein [Streptomyces sp. NPDC054765]
MAQWSSGAQTLPLGEPQGQEPLPHPGHGPGWSKVPQVTALFWGVKVLTTGMGETASDYLGRTLGPIPAGALGLAGFVVFLVLQFRATRYRPWTYWTAIVMVSVFGTMAADVVHVIAGIPYTVSAVAFSLALAALLTAWYRTEGTLSIHSIRTRRRETFYWATVLTTFALGTAVGDLTAGTLHLGYLPSGILFAALIAVPALSGRFLGLNAVAAFWWAYVLTRPLGASFADWMGVSTARGGLGWGTGPVTLALTVPIVLLVGYLAVSHKDTPSEQTAAGTA